MICPSAMISDRDKLGLPWFTPRCPITVLGCCTSKIQRYNATTQLLIVEVHARKNLSIADFETIDGLKNLKSFHCLVALNHTGVNVLIKDSSPTRFSLFYHFPQLEILFGIVELSHNRAQISLSASD